MVAAGGGTPAGAAVAAERLVAAGATALLSFGLCGGLDPALRAGAIVVPAGVTTTLGRFFSADVDLLALLGGATHETLYAGRVIAATVAEKSALAGAAAIDLESGAVAEIAARHRLPFAVLRAVCDPAGFSLPPAALIALDPAGGIVKLRIVGSILRHPAQLPALIELACAAATARAALVRHVAEIVHRNRGVL